MAAVLLNLFKLTLRLCISLLVSSYRNFTIGKIVRVFLFLISLRSSLHLFVVTTSSHPYCAAYQVGVELKEYLGNVNRAVPKFRLLWEGIDDILGQFTEACFVYGNCISSNVSSDIDFKRNCQLVAKGSFISLGYLTAAFAQPVSMLADQVEKYASAFVLKADLIEKMWCHLVIKFMPDMTRRTDDTVTMLTGRKSSVLTAHRPHSSKQTSVQSL